jgi:hypothetical protein
VDETHYNTNGGRNKARQNVIRAGKRSQKGVKEIGEEGKEQELRFPFARLLKQLLNLILPSSLEVQQR